MLPTKEELRQRYASFSNEKLLSVLYNKHEYTAEALEIAAAEMKARNLSVAEMQNFIQHQEEQKETKEMAALVPLTATEKIFFFFVWFVGLLIGKAFRMNYAEDNHVLKLKQSRVFSIAGLVSFLLVTSIAIWVNIGTLGFMGLLGLCFGFFYWRESKMDYSEKAIEPEIIENPEDIEGMS